MVKNTIILLKPFEITNSYPQKRKATSGLAAPHAGVYPVRAISEKVIEFQWSSSPGASGPYACRIVFLTI